MTPVTTTHIFLDDRGRAWIDDSNVKVTEVVRDKLGGCSPERIHRDHPHLSLAQIHAALTYYYDHQKAIDAEIARQDALVEKMRAENPVNPAFEKLRAQRSNP